MKQLLFSCAFVLASLIGIAQAKDSTAPKGAPSSDTLKLSLKEAPKVIVLADTAIYEVQRTAKGLFSVQFNGQIFDALIAMINSSTAPHTDVEAMKKFFLDQLTFKGLIQRQAAAPPKK